MGYQCTNGDGNAGVLLVSNLDNGETYAVCPACVPGWAKALSDAFPIEGSAEQSAPCPECGEVVTISEAEAHWTKHAQEHAPGPDDPTDDDEPRSVPDFPAPAGPTSHESSPGGPPGGDTDSETADLIERGKALDTVLDPATDPGPSSADVDEPGDDGTRGASSPVTDPASV